jgi:hypothetical protein
MNKVALAAFFDESEKIAMDTAVATEAFGVPGALYEGYHKSGLKGMAATGLGALGGMGAGMLATHYVKKLTGGQWGANHPLLKTIAEAAPIGMGGVIGGAMGGRAAEHFAGHKVASAGEYMLRKALQNAPQMVSEKRRIDALPDRMKMVAYALENNIPMGQVHLP